MIITASGPLSGLRSHAANTVPSTIEIVARTLRQLTQTGTPLDWREPGEFWLSVCHKDGNPTGAYSVGVTTGADDL